MHVWKDGTLLVVVDDYHYAAKPGGKAYEPSCFDLVNIPEKKKIEFWANIYSGGAVVISFLSREDADKHGTTSRTACLHFTREYVEGEGL